VTFKVSVTSSPMLPTSADRVLPASGGASPRKTAVCARWIKIGAGRRTYVTGPLSGCMPQKFTKTLLAPLLFGSCEAAVSYWRPVARERTSNGRESVVGWILCSFAPAAVPAGRQSPLAYAARSLRIAPKISLGAFARGTEIRWSKGTASELESTSSSFVQTVG
jgi:hypothetical protein